MYTNVPVNRLLEISKYSNSLKPPMIAGIVPMPAKANNYKHLNFKGKIQYTEIGNDL